MKIAEGKAADRKRSKGQCLAVGCTNHAKSTLCYHHERERKKEKNPFAYWYGVWRRNARRRHKVFTITLEYFIEFCNNTGYIDKKGRKCGNMTIDRRIDELGYIPGNIRALEHGANVRKRFTDYWMRQEFECPENYEPGIIPGEPVVIEDLPF